MLGDPDEDEERVVDGDAGTRARREPGWYKGNVERERYWDGQQWTDEFRQGGRRSDVHRADAVVPPDPRLGVVAALEESVVIHPGSEARRWFSVAGVGLVVLAVVAGILGLALALDW